MEKIANFKETIDQAGALFASIRADYKVKIDELDSLKESRDDYLLAALPREIALSNACAEIDLRLSEFDDKIEKYIRDTAMRRARMAVSSLSHDQVPPRLNHYIAGPQGSIGYTELMGLFGALVKDRAHSIAKKMDWPGVFENGVTDELREARLAELDAQIEALEAEVTAMRGDIIAAGGSFG